MGAETELLAAHNNEAALAAYMAVPVVINHPVYASNPSVHSEWRQVILYDPVNYTLYRILGFFILLMGFFFPFIWIFGVS